MVQSINQLNYTIRGVVSYTWPMILVTTLTLSILRIIYLVKNKKPFVLYRELLALFFLIYILCLFQVVTFQDVSNFKEGSNFIPFREIFRYSFGSRLFYKQVVGNLLLFVPFGFFMSYYLKLDKPYLLLLITMFTSIVIEVTQKMIGRIFDIDDILLNILGGLLGYLSYYVLNKIRSRLPEVMKKEGFLNCVAIVIVVVFIVYIYRMVV